MGLEQHRVEHDRHRHPVRLLPTGLEQDLTELHGEVIEVTYDDEGTATGRPTGRCRACPQRTYRSTGGNCDAVDPDPLCPRPLQARVGSWPGKCVYIHCPPDDDPNTLEHRSSTGRCTNLDDNDVCPLNADGEDDEKWYPQYGGCRKKSCPHGRYSNGNCRGCA